MSNIFKTAAAVTAALACLAACGAKPPHGDQPHSALLIGWDGADRAAVLSLLAKGELPNLAALAAEGGLVPTEVTTGETRTKPGWAEILTGRSGPRLGIISNKLYRPIPRGQTIFSRLKARYGANGIRTVFIGGKTENIGARGPHRIVANALSRHPGTRAPTHYLTERFDGPTEDGLPPRWEPREGEPYLLALEDLDVYEIGLKRTEKVKSRALRELEKCGKRRFFAFIHFPEPDASAHLHGEGSPQYLAALRETDAALGAILAALKNSGRRRATSVYVTSDHGIDKGAYTHNSAPHTFLATDSRRALRPGDRKDITPTILAGFGIETADLQLPLDGKTLAPEPAGKPLQVGYFLGGRTAILARMLYSGEFSREGISVQLLTRSLRGGAFAPLDPALIPEDMGKAAGTELIEGLLAGRWELATPGESSFLAAAAAGAPVVAVARLGYDQKGASGHVLAARRGVRLNSPADYRGRLFVSRRAGPGDAAFLLEYLASAGVDVAREVETLNELPASAAARRALPKDKVLVVHNVYEDDLFAALGRGVVDGGLFHLRTFERLGGKFYLVKPLHELTDPETSMALLVCTRAFLQSPANRARLSAFLRALIARTRYENALPPGERSAPGVNRWSSMQSLSPGLNYPQYSDYPVVDAAPLERMATLLRKHGLLADGRQPIEIFIDNSLVREAAAAGAAK